MPDEVRAEIGPYFNGRSAITDEQSEKLSKPGSTVDGDAAKQFIRKGLTVSWITMIYCFPGIVPKLPCLLSCVRFLMQLHYMEQPRWGDLDVNQHVNVKYIGWILEVKTLLLFIRI